jgi:hypothetical protein
VRAQWGAGVKLFGQITVTYEHDARTPPLEGEHLQVAKQLTIEQGRAVMGMLVAKGVRGRVIAMCTSPKPARGNRGLSTARSSYQIVYDSRD